VLSSEYYVSSSNLYSVCFHHLLYSAPTYLTVPTYVLANELYMYWLRLRAASGGISGRETLPPYIHVPMRMHV
jgi:hypothetical protein